MPLKIDPVTLTDCGRVIAFLGDDVKDPTRVPKLSADVCVESLRGSPIAVALGDADGADIQVRDVVQNRYHWIAQLLYTTAKNFHDSDIELALYMAGMGELSEDK
ncbi:hypothetical protein [Nocardia harenae]|uniref:hypothetical protein n=1 Tax=Nocardia harenae TaxID=358707 RepID=UPI00082A6C09|nr:hypothetical protein [Nocardia harenae]